MGPEPSQIKADCRNLHGVAPFISSSRQLQYGALRRRLKQEPSTPSALTLNYDTANRKPQKANL